MTRIWIDQGEKETDERKKELFQAVQNDLVNPRLTKILSRRLEWAHDKLKMDVLSKYGKKRDWITQAQEFDEVNELKQRYFEELFFGKVGGLFRNFDRSGLF